MEMKTSSSKQGQVIDRNAEEKVHLKRRVKLYQAFAFVAANIVGSSIYIVPGDILKTAGTPGVALGVWIIGGFLSFFGALCYAELAATFPESGEKMHYLDRMYGPFLAACSSWGYLLAVRPAADAIKILLIGNYILSLVFPDCGIPGAASRLIALIVFIPLMAVNIKNVEVANRAHSFMTAISVLALVVFSVIGLVYLGSGRTHQWNEPSSLIPPLNAGDFVMSIYMALYAYVGWNFLNFIVEEVKNPTKMISKTIGNFFLSWTIPRALLLAVGSITLLYVMVNVAYLTVLGPDGMITSPAVAMTFGQAAFPIVAWLVPMVVSFSQLSSCNTGILVGSRLMFATARRGLFPQNVALITTWSYSPIISLIIHACLVLAFAVFFDILPLIKNMMFILTLFDTLVVAGLVRFRIRFPDLHRPFKTPFAVPVIYLVINILLLVVPLVTKPLEAAIGAMFVLGTSIPLYALFVAYRWRPRNLMNVLGHVTIFLQKVLLCVPQEQDVKY